MVVIHELKIWPEFFIPVREGLKKFEYRKDDRGFRVGDTILLKEYNPDDGCYTGRKLSVKITYILRTFGSIMEGFCIMSIERID